MTYETILASVHDGVGTITLNRPDRLNALTPKMAGEIVEALYGFPEQGARAVLIRAEGKGFCSGTDLQGEGGIPDDVGVVLEESYNPALLKIMASPLPIVAAVHGPCAGIGVSLALAADFVIAARCSYFLQAFVNIGLVPDGGATWMLPRLVGRARAVEMMMLGEKVSAEKAHEWGMIHKVVDDREFEAEARAFAHHLSRGPTRVYGLIRKGMAQALECDFAEMLGIERLHQREAGRTEDFREGITAFLFKRPPVFKGR